MRGIALRATVAAVASAGCAFGAFGITASPAGAATLPTLTLTLTGKSVAVGGQTVSGAVNVLTSVSGERQGSAALIRFNPGYGPADFAAAAKAVNAHHGDLNYVAPYGSIVFDQPVVKGTNTAQTILAPGQYVAIDSGNTGPGQTPPFAFFTVSANPSAIAALPAPGATLSAVEFGFRGPGTLHNGEVVRFTNDGFLVHMIAAIKVKNAKTARQVTRLLRQGRDNKAQKLAQGFVDFYDMMSRGGMLQYVIHATPGTYVLACFMTTEDGREHTRLGMERTIRIKK